MKNNKGFTLLEIIVVVFILSLLAAIVAPKIIGRTDDARIAEAKIQIKNFETALKLFKLDNGFYPVYGTGTRSACGTDRQRARYRRNTGKAGILNRRRIPARPMEQSLYLHISRIER